MLDAVNLEKLGIPTVTLVTEPFTVAAGTVARSLGMPDVPRVAVPHDYLTESDGTIARKLEPLVDRILDQLLIR